MAPLRERLAQESVIEARKSSDAEVVSKAIVSMANGYIKKLIKERRYHEFLKQLTGQFRLGATYRMHVEHANLSWAVDGIEKAALSTGNDATRNGELERSVKYLKVLATSESSTVTALAHLYLAMIWSLRHNQHKVAWHVLVMFSSCPHLARSDVAPGLWEELFLPRFAGLESWYRKEVGSLMKRRVSSETRVSPRSSLSFEALYADLKGFWHQLQPSSGSRSGALEASHIEDDKLHVLRKLYQEALDENTRKFGEFYRNVIICCHEKRNRKLSFPCVKTPQFRVQFVQREVLSRNNLVGDTSVKENDRQRSSSGKLIKTVELPVPNCDGRLSCQTSGASSPAIWKSSQDYETSPANSTISFVSPLSSTKSVCEGSFDGIEDVIQVESPVAESSDDACEDRTPDLKVIRKKHARSSTTKHACTPNNIQDLKEAVATLCSAKSLRECEQVVPLIARVWMESKGNTRVEAFLTKLVVIDVMMEFLSTSKTVQIQRATVCLLTDFVHKNEQVRRRVVAHDHKFEWARRILQQGHIPQTVVLLYLLKLSRKQLESLNLIPALVGVLEGQVDSQDVLRAPKAAAVFLLEQLVSLDSTNVAELLVYLDAIPCILQRLHSDTPEEQVSAMVILLCCMQADQTCGRYISEKCKPSLLTPMVQCSDRRSRTVVLAFLQTLLSAKG